jgi:hypothetical protein
VTFTYPGRSSALPRGFFQVGLERPRIAGPKRLRKSTIGNLLLRFWEYDLGDTLEASPRAMLPTCAHNGFASQHPILLRHLGL